MSDEWTPQPVPEATVTFPEAGGPPPSTPAPRDPGRWLGGRLLGMGALAVAVFAVPVQVVAIAVASHGAWTPGWTLAWVDVALGVVAVVMGVFALVRSRGRRWAVAAVVLAVAGDPLVLVALFRLLGA